MPSCGMAPSLLCVFFYLHMIGLILAILSRREPDRWYFFSYAGIVLNGAVVALCFVTMYLGLVV